MLLIDTKEHEETSERVAARLDRANRRRQRLRDVGLVVGITAIVGSIPLIVLLSPRGPLGDDGQSHDGHAPDAGPTATSPAPTAAEAKGVRFEKFKRVDPALPAIPGGPVKHFKVDVYEHVTKVSDDLAPTEVWSYAINGVEHRGTGVSEPMVVEVGDRVKIDLINGSSERMSVRMPHSIDYHSSEINPGEAFKTIPPGGRHSFEFTAKYPGVFMYHCATDPVLHHTGAGMVGAMIVKPKNLAPVDRELWINQQEFYIGKPGGQADMQKMEAKQPDVIAFNGYAAQ
jgi:nitrite reductase (NO-forming)